MFVQGTSDLERPYHRLRPALIDGPSWLGSLAPPALIEVLTLTSKTPLTADQHETLTRVRDAFRCRIGPIHLHVDAITLPMRWLSPLDAWQFPPDLYADLHLAGRGPTRSQLTFRGNYSRPEPPADPDVIHQTVQAVIDTYLRDVSITLNDQTT
jgi:hypothetical protein